MFSENFLNDLIKKGLSRGGDYCDLFLEETAQTRLAFDDGKIKSVSSGIICGAGLRIIYGKSFVYFFCSDPTEEKLLALAEEASGAVKAEKRGVRPLGGLQRDTIHRIEVSPEVVDTESKAALILEADAAARDYSPAVKEVLINYLDNKQSVTIATSEGTYAEDLRTRTRFAVTTVAQKGDKKETGFYGPGRSMGFEFFDKFPTQKIARESARIACLLLDADFAPQGKLPVIIENAFGGVIFHEACGHALEATSVADNASVFTGKLGRKVASDVVSAVDDATIPNGWGSAAYDDEGAKTRKIILIRGGVLESYLVDKLGSIKMDHPITGSGRRESYKFAPTSRMSNTFITPGKSTVEEMISSIDNGVYCANMGGGSVEPATTDFNFSVQEAYLIKQGKIDRPIKGAALIGKGSEIIKNIEMVGDNLDFGTGMCGSISGSVPAFVGQPAIKVSGLVVGGRKG